MRDVSHTSSSLADPNSQASDSAVHAAAELAPSDALSQPKETTQDLAQGSSIVPHPPFDILHQLPRKTAAQIALQAAVLKGFGTAPLAARFRHSVAEKLGDRVRAQCQIAKKVATAAIEGPKLATYLQGRRVTAMLGVAGTSHVILMDIESPMALYCIDRLLGGEGESSRIKRPITEIEEGVLSFLLLEFLDILSGHWQDEAYQDSFIQSAGLTLQGFVQDAETLTTLAKDAGSYRLLATKVALEQRVGSIRFFVPSALIPHMPLDTPGIGPLQEGESERMLRALPSLEGLNVPLRWQACQIDLEPDERNALEVGDIIVLEHHALSYDEEGLQGSAIGVFGAGLYGQLSGTLKSADGACQIVLGPFRNQEHPTEAPTMQQDDQDNSDPYANDGLENMSDESSAGDMQAHGFDEEGFGEESSEAGFGEESSEVGFGEENSEAGYGDLPPDSSIDPLNAGDSASLSDQDEAYAEATQNTSIHAAQVASTHNLLQNVAAPIVVELGRLNLNAGQVARLAPGQVMRLPRNPTDPVDLVVEGKIFARGALISVDGELGVQIVQLASDPKTNDA